MGGVANMLGNLFGGGYEAPEPPKYEPAPLTEDKDVEAEATRNAEMRKNRARAGGVRSTLLSSPLGAGGAGAAGAARNLLGSSAGSGA